MLRISLVAGAATLLLAMPAMAQNSMSSASPSNSMSAADTSSMTCDQMMAKEQTMSANGTGAKLAMAQKERTLATQAKGSGDEAGCKMHMTKAMNALK